jgi:NADH-quinone oxidoreductase subunit F
VELLQEEPGDLKYLICNADEGDPGAFMDRSARGRPARRARGHDDRRLRDRRQRGLHLRARRVPAGHPAPAHRHRQAEAARLPRPDILGTGFHFDIKIKEGAGAFVCGEETALFASIEGERGMPRIRPPFPAEAGLWGKPTNINNVETYANVPWIVRNGADAYGLRHREVHRHQGLLLAGKIEKGGLVEVPMGIPCAR